MPIDTQAFLDAAERGATHEIDGLLAGSGSELDSDDRVTVILGLEKAAERGAVDFIRAVGTRVPDVVGRAVKFKDSVVVPAFAAAAAGHADCLRALAEVGSKALGKPVDETGRNEALLATANGHLECLEVLAELAPEVFARAYRNGVTSAHIAANNGREDLLPLIAGISPESLGPSQIVRLGEPVDDPFNALNPAHLAARGGHTGCLKIIAEHAPETLGQPWAKAGWMSPEERAIWLRIEAQGVAEEKGISAAIGRGLDPARSEDLRSDQGFLRSIREEWSTVGFDWQVETELASQLLSPPAPLAPGQWEQYYDEVTSWMVGATPALYAAQAGHLECLEIIAERAPQSLGLANQLGLTPALCASMTDRTDCLALISRVDARALTVGDRNGGTPAHYLAARANTAGIELVASALPAALGARDRGGNTPGILAAERGHGPCLQRILSAAPDTVSARNGAGVTAAVAAAAGGHTECLGILADLDHRTLQGKWPLLGTPEVLAAAHKGRHAACVALIRDRTQNEKLRIKASKLLSRMG